MVDYLISSNPRCNWLHGKKKKQKHLAYIFQLPKSVLYQRTTWVISSDARASVKQELPLSSLSMPCVIWSSEMLSFGLQSYTLTYRHVKWSGARRHYFLVRLPSSYEVAWDMYLFKLRHWDAAILCGSLLGLRTTSVLLSYCDGSGWMEF